MAGLWKRLFGVAEARRAAIKPFDVEVSVEPQQTLLEAALARDVPFPHSCTVGTCSSCKCRLISGKVRAVSDFGYTLSKEELQAGYILACQAMPLTDLVIEVESPGDDAPPSESFTGRTVSHTSLTPDIRAVTIELDRPIRYVAGQFLTIASDGLAPRSYSFADPPDRNGRQEVTFFIRKAPGGAFTERLFAGALDGVDLALEGPNGQFFLRPNDGPMICVAGGSGLAPLMSLLLDARKKNIKRSCTLLFGARTRADLYILEEIEQLAQDWLGGFEFLPILSEEPSGSEWAGRRGLVTDALARLLEAQPEVSRAQAYMCGPPPMIDAAITLLVGAGLDFASIHFDKFRDSRTLGQESQASPDRDDPRV